MRVRKVRGQNKVGKIILFRWEVIVAERMGMKVEDYVKHELIGIAKKRRWDWFFNKEKA